MAILINISIKNQRLTITDDKYDILYNASKTVSHKQDLTWTLETLLDLGKADYPEETEYLETLEKGIQLSNESDNLNQFRQKVKQLKNQE